METLALKNRIKDYIDSADERMLRIFNAIIESESEEIPEEHKKILDFRLQLHEENPTEGKSWAEVKDSLQKKYGV